MPGIRTMNSSGADGATGATDSGNKKRTYEGKLVNGERNAVERDSPAQGEGVNWPTNATGVNGTALSMSAVEQLPPEIVHLSSEFYHPLSKLLLRVSQDCYNDLNEVLQSMAELPTSSQANGVMTNGLGPYGLTNGAGDYSEANKQKKLMLMRFAQHNRAKFIKLLVLTEWGKKAAVDVSKLIDIFSWSREQSASMDAVDFQIENLKILSNHARQFNPDIRTALEVLATGKAGWIPDMGFVPPSPISADRALKLLRYMNASLSIRLNVHEDLPRHLQKWRVESGRATFTVDNEFELDVISFVEDNSDQWHFIDLRLLFLPAPSIAIQSRFLQTLKLHLDHLLAQAGLSGCFDYLHNFILTHKIAILRSQANDLLRTGWAGSLKVEPVHRSLVLQYWTDRPGKKSWIEIGLSSNRHRNDRMAWRGPPVSSLTVRWFRQGVEVKDVDLKFDWKQLSMERMLKRVISLHIQYLLESARRNLTLGTVVKARLSETEPSECVLEASLGTSANRTSVSVEPVTGKYILQPATAQSAGAEAAMNHPDQKASTGLIITQLLARSLRDVIQGYAQQLGWQEVSRQALRLDVVKATTKLDVLQYAFYRPRGWSPRWALAAVIDASGESWWICEIGDKGNTIENAQRLGMDKKHSCPPPIGRVTFGSIERVAVHTVAFYINAKALQKEGKPYSFGYEFTQPRRSAASHGVLRGWALYVKTSDVLPSKPGEAPWLEPGLRIMCEGMRSDARSVWHIASGTMMPDVAAQMKKLMASSPQKDFSFSEDGHFSILLSAPFGEGVVGELRARLRDVDRLRSFATTLQKRRMPLKSSSLQQMRFQYGESSLATVNFDKGDNISVAFGHSNPHNRIRKFLDEMVNERYPPISALFPADSTALDRFCLTLIITRPILSILSEIEDVTVGNLTNPSVHAHAIGTYCVKYANPQCSFDVRLRPKDDQVWWVIEEHDGKLSDVRSSQERTSSLGRPEALKTALRSLFRDTGERWFGMRTGIVAEIDGIPDALKRLHKTVISCAAGGGAKPEPGTNSDSTQPMPPSQPNGGGSDPSRKPSGGNGGPSNGRQQVPPGRISNAANNVMGVKREVITID